MLSRHFHHPHVPPALAFNEYVAPVATTQHISKRDAMVSGIPNWPSLELLLSTIAILECSTRIGRGLTYADY